ncbi:MAG TPA: hypothetical protein DD381_04335 [Lentisphaeria bacterium]|nr:MAG: hypothetical protein A2X47_07315 [Lentisphaerae bacterium GWF2_38_69]HBM15560.1 hypothetical protein [Lentisphaeria bacterium]
MPSRIASLLEAIKLKRPVLASLLDKYGKKTLGEFTKGFKDTSSFHNKSIQSRADLIELAASYTENLLGTDIASRFASRLSTNANLLTANHHCVNISDLPIQGTLAFALSENINGIVPVFAFGDIPLNNSRYPRGILFAGDKKLPIFPDKYKNTLVSSSPPFTEDFVLKAIERNSKMHSESQITEAQYKQSEQLLKKMYMNPKVLACSSYSDQALILSNLIWKKLFTDDSSYRNLELVHLEIEKIVSQLLLKDIKNPSSLAYNLFFNPTLRSTLISELDGKNGCWNMEILKNLLIQDKTNFESDLDPSAGSGTAFFWGIDSKGRRIPLYLNMSSERNALLEGLSDSREKFEIPFTPESISDNLKKKNIIPGLFLSFAIVSFARGYKCYGGFMQVDYLTVMRNGLSKALKSNNFNDWAEIVNNIETENYCTGMIFALFSPDKNIVVPAGGLEIASSGGLNDSDINKICSITLEDSNLFGLPRIYKTVFRPDERSEELSSVTPLEIFNHKKDNFLIIH